MKKIITYNIAFMLFLSLFSFSKLTAQVIIYSQNFDSSAMIPTGWDTTAGGWTLDRADGANISTGYVGASGGYNMLIQNTSATGNYDLTSNNISTLNYSDIVVDWAARYTKHFADSGSSITGFYWSNNNGNTWNAISYTENSPNSNWGIDDAGVPIILPAGAAHQATLKFKWSAYIKNNNAGGTYRLDDLTVGGTVATGINSPAEPSNALANIYVINSNIISITSNNITGEKLNIEVYNVLGKLVKNQLMNSSSVLINAFNLSAGVYFVRVSSPETSIVNKVVLKK